MIVNYFFVKPLISKLFLSVAILCMAVSTPGQNTDIVLFGERLALTPKEFYISNVIDERENHDPIAQIISTVASKSSAPKTYAVDLRGGMLPAVKQFIMRSLTADTTLLPVIIGVKQISVIEKALPGGRAEGHITVAMAYYLDKGDGEKNHLTDFNGSGLYNRPAGAPQQIEPTLRKVLQNGLIYLNSWMNKQAAGNIKLAKGVALKFDKYDERAEGDTIYYNKNRPLRWSDFQSKIPNSKYEAEVFPIIGYDERNEIINGIIVITITMKVGLPKSACWARQGSETSYALNHEQRHFDIAAIVAERFKRKLDKEVLSVGNYDGTINVDYLDAYREMNRLEKQYDDETNHGSNIAAQQMWNEKIDKDLNKPGLK